MYSKGWPFKILSWTSERFLNGHKLMNAFVNANSNLWDQYEIEFTCYSNALWIYVQH